MSLHFERVEADFQRALSEAIRNMKDPRMASMTSVLRTELSKDLKHAKVHVSVFEEDQEKKKEVLKVLDKASSMLAREINSKVKMRRVPQMHFILDDSIAYSAHINKLLNEINVGRDEKNSEENENFENEEKNE